MEFYENDEGNDESYDSYAMMILARVTLISIMMN